MSSPSPVPARLAYSFASDNYAGVHPSVLAALTAANGGHAAAYGADGESAQLQALVCRLFGAGSVALPVFNGTGANVLALTACCARWEAVVCADSAHVHCDEGGAPEKVAGLKLWTVACAAGDGKLTPAALAAALAGPRDNVHRAQPGAVSIANTTEMGTVYTAAEVRALADAAHAAGLLLHMDGARLSNAAAALGLPLRAFTSDAGVDVLSLGGTKIGAMGAEAVVLLPRAGSGAPAPALAAALPFLRKTFMQLASKQRFISAQLIALFDDGLALRLATHANAMAARLEAGLRSIPGVVLPTRCEANACFPILPAAANAALKKQFRFYVRPPSTPAARARPRRVAAARALATARLPPLPLLARALPQDWVEAIGQVRLMCSWDTTETQVDVLLAAVREVMAAHPPA